MKALIALITISASAIATRQLETLDEGELDYEKDRMLEDYTGNYDNSWTHSGAYGMNFFADSQDTYYDGYQQAWRYLGHLVKCGYPSDRYDEQEEHHSHDEDDGRLSGNNYCQRFLVWAAVSTL
jgi:hypothetical protein